MSERPRALLTWLLIALVAASCERQGAEDRPQPNVYLLVVDALRADHVSAHGYRRDTTPCLDRLAAEGVLFERARSASNYTRSSVPSLFTGFQPSVHGVVEPSDRLHDGFETLAEYFSAAGYATAAWAPNPSLERRLNFGQGFEHYDDQVLDPEAEEEWLQFETVRRINSRALRFAEEANRRPLFLYLHYRDVHGPYLPPPEYRNLFWNEREIGQVEMRALTPAELEVMPTYLRLESGPQVREYYVSQYDAEIRYTDDEICGLLSELERRGLLQNSLIVVTSDHGEAFLEHGRWNHGNELFEEEIRVPLVLAGSVLGARAGVRLATPAQGVDVMPTILELAGLRVRRQLQGISLVPLLEGGTLPARTVFAEGKKSIRLAAIYGEYKLLRNARTGAWALYDLAADPGEIEDLFEESHPRARYLGGELGRYRRQAAELARSFPVRKIPSTPKLEQDLKALGYL